LAAKLVELTIDAYEKTGDVGGHVNAVMLGKDVTANPPRTYYRAS
jgi:hypothetical protein